MFVINCADNNSSCNKKSFKGGSPLSIGIIESGLVYFAIGILLGSSASIIIMKFYIKKRLKKFYNLVNELQLYKLRLKKERERKIKALKLIKNKIYTSKENSDPAKYESFDSYLSELNHILNNNRINTIDNAVPPA